MVWREQHALNLMYLRGLDQAMNVIIMTHMNDALRRSNAMLAERCQEITDMYVAEFGRAPNGETFKHYME